jgi:hypothetical protein
MAAGDSKLFNEYVLKERRGDYSQSDTWSLAFVSDTYASINADNANPNLSVVTVTSGGNVSSSYTLTGVAYSRATSTITFSANNIGQILKDAANPSDVRCAVIYNDTSTSDDLVQVFDMTSDGSTALDLVNNDFTFSFAASGINEAVV